MDRTEKREVVASLSATLASMPIVVVTRNDGLTVAEVSELRRRMREAGATFRVTKNRLAALALRGTPFEAVVPMLKGPTALAWSKDPVVTAKTVVTFAKANEKLVIIGGAVGTRTLDADGVKALADLPSLDALRAKLLGVLKALPTRVAAMLAAPAGQLARVIGAYARKDEAS